MENMQDNSITTGLMLFISICMKIHTIVTKRKYGTSLSLSLSSLTPQYLGLNLGERGSTTYIKDECSYDSDKFINIIIEKKC